MIISCKEKLKDFLVKAGKIMFCYKCGAENDDNSQYCWKCGTLIKKEQEVKIQDTVEKNNKSIKSFVIVFFILLLVTCSVLFLINNNRKQLYVFTVKDEQGNILMDGGIETAKISQAAVRNGGSVYTVQILLEGDAAIEYQSITGMNIGNTFYYYVDDECIGAGVIDETVTNGMISIEQANLEEAEQLADKLKNTVL